MKNFNIEMSNEFYKMNGTRDMYNGTSFKVSQWEPNTFYAHDDHIIDFVIYQDCLLVCKRSHWSSNENSPLILENDGDILGIQDSPCWEFVHGRGLRGHKGDKGDKGDRGEKGEKGDTSIDGHLSVTASALPSETATVEAELKNNNIAFKFGLPKGPAGKDGKDGRDGINGTDGKDGKDGISPNTSFKSIVFIRSQHKPEKPLDGSYEYPIPTNWNDGIPAILENEPEYQVWMSSRIFSSDGKSPQQSEWTDPQPMTDTASFDVEFSSEVTPGTPDTNADAWSNEASESTIWMATRTCHNGEWSTWKVSKIKGEKGDKGDRGPVGKSISSTNVYFGKSSSSSIQPTEWVDDASNLDMQVHEWLWSKTVTMYTEGVPFESIVCLSQSVKDGVNGLDGKDGSDGKDGQDGKNGNGIVSVKELYYLHDSYLETPKESVEWLENCPEIVSGKYIWIKLVITFDDSTTKVVGPYCSTGLKGEDGAGVEYIFRLSANITSEFDSITDLDAVQSNNYKPGGWEDNILEVTEELPYLYASIRRRIDGEWSKFNKPVIWTRFVKSGLPGINMFTAFAFVRTNDDLTNVIPVGGSYSDPNPDKNIYEWSDSAPSGEEKLWMTSCVFASDEKYNGGWTQPIVLTNTSSFEVKFSSVEEPGEVTESNTNWTATASNPIWMATRTINNGISSNWVISKVKGEKGADGTSITIKGAKNSIDELPTENNSLGDCYVVQEYLYIWDGDSWENAGRFKGDQGKSGPMIYPAGIWNPTLEYSRTDKSVPYVSYKNENTSKVEYYLLVKSTGSYRPDITEAEYWEKFDQFKAVYADIGVFEQALVGQAVFYGDYMFSQNGIDENDEASSDFHNFMVSAYEGFIINDPYDKNAKFKPTYCVNLKTGQSWMGAGEIMFQKYGKMPVCTYGDEFNDQSGYGRIGNILFNKEGLTFLEYDDAYDKWMIPNTYLNIAPSGSISVEGPVSDIDDTRIKYWELNSNGSGSLANGNFSWTWDGHITHGGLTKYKVADNIVDNNGTKELHVNSNIITDIILSANNIEHVVLPELQNGEYTEISYRSELVSRGLQAPITFSAINGMFKDYFDTTDFISTYQSNTNGASVKFFGFGTSLGTHWLVLDEYSIIYNG